VAGVPLRPARRQHEIDLRRPRDAEGRPFLRPLFLVERRVEGAEARRRRLDVVDKRHEIDVLGGKTGNARAADKMELRLG
jgi:hypothetical protein